MTVTVIVAGGGSIDLDADPATITRLHDAMRPGRKAHTVKATTTTGRPITISAYHLAAVLAPAPAPATPRQARRR